MSKAALILKGTGMVGAVQATLTQFVESGTSQKQIQLTMASGHRIRVVEGMLAFANAECLRPGDEIEFEFQDILKGSYKAGKDTEREREVATQDFVGIGEIKVVAIGAFSDVADKVLTDAGRQPMAYVERKVEPKNAQHTPPKPADAAAGAQEAAPFAEDGH